MPEWPLEHCLDVLKEFDRLLPSKLAPTPKRYLAMYYDHDNWPTPSYFAIFGGFRALSCSRCARGGRSGDPGHWTM